MYTIEELLSDLHYTNQLALALDSVDVAKLTEDQQTALKASVFVVKFMLEQITYSLEHEIPRGATICAHGVEPFDCRICFPRVGE